MTDRTNEIEGLTAEIDRLTIAHPHASSLLQAFGPLVLNQHRWLRDRQEKGRIFPVDPLKYQEGISLSQQTRLFLPEDPWQEAGLSVASAIGQGFPQFTGDMLRLSRQIRDEEVDCFALCDATDDSDQIIDEAQTLGIDPVALRLFHRYLTRLMLAKRAQDMPTDFASLSWKKGYCPICGSFPHLAILREKGQRWLQCATCSHEWPFSRLACPYCDHEDPQTTNSYFVDEGKENTAFTCSKCQKYLVTSNQSGNLRQNHAELVALCLAHLDLILQEQGFLPMAECEWNTFAFPQETTR